jgi:hypothetical protein
MHLRSLEYSDTVIRTSRLIINNILPDHKLASLNWQNELSTFGHRHDSSPEKVQVKERGSAEEKSRID